MSASTFVNRETAVEALKMATVDPAMAARSARIAERRARAEEDWQTASIAGRAAGVAAMQLRDLSGAIGHLRAAIEAATRAGSPRLAGESHMSLASALILRGIPAEAFLAIDMALRELDGLEAARALTQRAAILQELGRIDDALEDLRHAIPQLRRSGDVPWEARALSNRSLVYISRRSFGAAEADLLRASRLCSEHGLLLPGGYAAQNLGCLYASKGDVPAALRQFAAAESLYRDLGLVVGSLFVDRAQVLLSVRLLEEARRTAQEAVDALRGQRRWVELPEAHLLLSTIALFQRDTPVARRAASQAERSLTRLGRRQTLPLARYATLQALVAESSTTVTPSRARRCADDLERENWIVPSLDARILAGRLSLERGETDLARKDLLAASKARFAGSADARSRAWLAEALLRKSEGRRPAAYAALTAGLRVVEAHRLTMGATELRAHTSMHRGALALMGLRMALEDRRAARVHWWSERGRASATALRPVRPPEDQALAQYLEDLRTTMAELEVKRAHAEPADALVDRQVAIERSVQEHCRLAPGVGWSSVAPPPDRRELTAGVGADALVEYVELDDRLHAVTFVDGRFQLHQLGVVDQVRHCLKYVPFALHRLSAPRSSPARREGALAVLAHARETFQTVLFDPIHKAVGDRPLIITCNGWLMSLPWAMVPACRGRAVTVTPSVTLWHLARSREPQEGPAMVVAGPGLKGAELEARAVAALHPGARQLLGPAATAEAIGQAMEGVSLVHVAAHGILRSDNPLFSCLQVADGPFTVYDLERLTRTPSHVVLAACETARSHVLPGSEILGLAAAFLSHGTATLVAPVVNVPDAETTPLMLTYHTLLRRGCSPAAALAEAQEQRHHDGAAASAGALGFICLGAGS